MRQNIGLLIALALAASISGPVRADDEKIAERTFRAYWTLIESIDTFECKVTVTGTALGQSGKREARYYRKGDKEKYTPAGSSYPIVRAGTVIKKIEDTDPGKPSGKLGSISAYHPLQFASRDPWTSLHFREAQYDAELAERFKDKRPFRLYQVTPTTDAGGLGHRSVVIKYVTDSGSVKGGWVDTFEFDESYNHLLTRFEREVATKDSHRVSVTRYLKVKEFAPGIYLPQEIEGTARDLRTNQVKGPSHVKLSDVKVNHTIDDAVFDLKFPKGMLVQDLIKRVEYTADEAGNPDGPVRPLPKPVKP